MRPTKPGLSSTTHELFRWLLTFGGCEKPKDLATANSSKVCTLKMSFIWWLL